MSVLRLRARMRTRRRLTPRRHRIEVTHQPVFLERLPLAFAGLRIVQLSDIHHGLYTAVKQVENAVELANRFHPDLVALTGDFVTQSRNYVQPVARALGRLRARLGCFAVLGNHDFRVGADAVAGALEREGIHVLRNRNVRLHHNGASVALAGVDDFRYRETDLRQALRALEPTDVVLLLAHNPVVARQAATYGVDLVLSGHTHGGQVGLVRLKALARRRGVRFPFRHGLERVGQTQLYISRGIGTVVVPVRYRCPAEIPVLRLQASNHRVSTPQPSDDAFL